MDTDKQRMNTDRIIRLTCFIIAVVVIAAWASTVAAVEKRTDAQARSGNVLTLFYGQGCPHCEEEKKFLKELKARQPGLTIREYEVWHDTKNAALFAKIMKAAGSNQVAVPVTVVGKKVFVGFTKETGQNIEKAVAACIESGCPDAVADMPPAGTPGQEKMNIPLLGEVDTGTVSLPVLTVGIALLDSFNPCAFFVLLFLLSMLIHARSRGKMFLIGGIFVFFSGFIYFLFMAAWLNLFLVIGKLVLITATAGVIALFVGAINIKDFFFFKKGISFMIPENAKPRLFEQMRGLLRSSSLTTMIAGTVVLAVSANAYELLCTAGFPMVYTRALTLHNLPMTRYYLYLVVYNLVYVIPLALIVLVMTLSLGSRKLSEWQGRQLKLMSGLMMFFLGLVLLVQPALLNNAAASAVLLVVVVGLSGAVIYAAKRIRPEIATE